MGASPEEYSESRSQTSWEDVSGKTLLKRAMCCGGSRGDRLQGPVLPAQGPLCVHSGSPGVWSIPYLVGSSGLVGLRLCPPAEKELASGERKLGDGWLLGSCLLSSPGQALGASWVSW